jgi:hypothetical protein
MTTSAIGWGAMPDGTTATARRRPAAARWADARTTEGKAVRAARAEKLCKVKPDGIAAVRIGRGWLYNIVPGSVSIDKDCMSIEFDVLWNVTGEIKHYSAGLEQVSGYETTKGKT